MRYRRWSGHSLLELLVAMALSLVVLGLMFSFLIPTLRASTKGQIRADMAQQAMLALGRIADDLQRSTPAGVSLNDAEFSAIMPKTGPPGGPPPVAPPELYPVILAIQRINYEDVASGEAEYQGYFQVYLWNPDLAVGPPLGGTTIHVTAGGIAQVGDLITYQTATGMTFPCGSTAPFANAPTKLSDAQLTGMPSSLPASPTILATGVSYFVVATDDVSKSKTGAVLPIINNPVTVFIQLVRQGATGALYPESEFQPNSYHAQHPVGYFPEVLEIRYDSWSRRKNSGDSMRNF